MPCKIRLQPPPPQKKEKTLIHNNEFYYEMGYHAFKQFREYRLGTINGTVQYLQRKLIVKIIDYEYNNE